MLLIVALILDLTSSFWIARSRLGGRNGRSRFGRFGRSDPSLENGIDVAILAQKKYNKDSYRILNYLLLELGNSDVNVLQCF